MFRSKKSKKGVEENREKKYIFYFKLLIIAVPSNIRSVKVRGLYLETERYKNR
jgi:hypothetical protein